MTKKKLTKESRDSTVKAYAKEKRLDPVSFLRGWNMVKNRSKSDEQNTKHRKNGVRK